MKTISAKEIHEREMAEDPEYRAAYEALEEEFALIEAMMDASASAPACPRPKSHSRMGTTESAVSRLESGRDQALDPHAGALCRRHRSPSEDQL